MHLKCRRRKLADMRARESLEHKLQAISGNKVQKKKLRICFAEAKLTQVSLALVGRLRWLWNVRKCWRAIMRMSTTIL